MSPNQALLTLQAGYTDVVRCFPARSRGHTQNQVFSGSAPSQLRAEPFASPQVPNLATTLPDRLQLVQGGADATCELVNELAEFLVAQYPGVTVVRDASWLAQNRLQLWLPPVASSSSLPVLLPPSLLRFCTSVSRPRPQPVPAASPRLVPRPATRRVFHTTFPSVPACLPCTRLYRLKAKPLLVQSHLPTPTVPRSLSPRHLSPHVTHRLPPAHSTPSCLLSPPLTRQTSPLF
jgi:hypothetical protein